MGPSVALVFEWLSDQDRTGAVGKVNVCNAVRSMATASVLHHDGMSYYQHVKCSQRDYDRVSPVWCRACFNVRLSYITVSYAKSNGVRRGAEGTLHNRGQVENIYNASSKHRTIGWIQKQLQSYTALLMYKISRTTEE